MPSKQDDSTQVLAGIVSQVLTDIFRESCTPALEAVTAAEKPASLPENGDIAWFRMNLGGALEGPAYLGIETVNILALGIRETGASTPETGASALLSLLQSRTLRLQELAAEPYGTLTVVWERATGPALLPKARFTAIAAQSEAGNVQATLYLCFEPQLVAGFQRPGGMLFPEPVPAGPPSTENLELVLDVELNATLRFGQRQLSLREILDLTSGSVVELDRQVDEPVELILDGRVIARGEAVIIDGNYGMRITEVLQPVTGMARSH